MTIEIKSEAEFDSSSPGCGPLIPPLTGAMRSLKRQIFERVRAAGRISRIEVARALGVSPASVTTFTSELIDDGLLQETAAPRDSKDSGRGRPPVALEVRAEAHFVAGVKFSDHDFTAVVVDFRGKVVASETVEVSPKAHDVADVMDRCENLLKKVTKSAGLSIRDLSAVGLGIPGFVEADQGLVLWSPVLQPRNVPLGKLAHDRLGVPVVIENDANLVTLAELWFGVGRDLANYAVVTIEHGVGMGFVMNHKLYRGSTGVGMELGHTKVQLDGALCRCGQRGCLEAYVADYALVREAMTALNWSPSQTRTTPVLLEHLFHQAKAGNGAAKTIFRRAGRYLALGLANVTTLFDPSLIILAGARMRFDYLYAAEALAEMDDLVLNTGRAHPPVQVHAWGDLLWARGAAALALAHVSDQILDQRALAAE